MKSRINPYITWPDMRSSMFHLTTATAVDLFSFSYTCSYLSFNYILSYHSSISHLTCCIRRRSFHHRSTLPTHPTMQAFPRPVLRLATNLPFVRTFSVAPAVMSAGDLGSTKPRGFMAEYAYASELWWRHSYLTLGRKDSFTKREAAHEGMYIKQLEMEKWALRWYFPFAFDSDNT